MNRENRKDDAQLHCLEVKQEGTEEELIDAGDVTEFKELPSHRYHRAVTTRKLAFLLVWMMGLSVAVHYAATVVLLICEHRFKREPFLPE